MQVSGNFFKVVVYAVIIFGVGDVVDDPSHGLVPGGFSA